MAAEIDEEVSRVINYAYEMAKKIITSRKNALAAIADALMSRETLEQEDFYGILKPFKLKPLAI